MSLIRLFDEKNCMKNNCPLVYDYNCFGNPETCKINNKAGYPKEVSNGSSN